MQGWSREQYGDETGLPWVLPSPNIPTVDSAVVYPGTVLLEGTNISEGRGTTRPFELVGAPWADPESVARESERARSARRAFPARRSSSRRFTSTPDTPCGGCQIHVTDRSAFRAVETGVAVIEAFRRGRRGQFAWRATAVRVRAHEAADRHPVRIGGVREPASTAARRRGHLRRNWPAQVEPFADVRRQFLLYGRVVDLGRGAWAIVEWGFGFDRRVFVTRSRASAGVALRVGYRRRARRTTAGGLDDPADGRRRKESADRERHRAGGRQEAVRRASASAATARTARATVPMATSRIRHDMDLTVAGARGAESRRRRLLQDLERPHVAEDAGVLRRN